MVRAAPKWAGGFLMSLLVAAAAACSQSHAAAPAAGAQMAPVPPPAGVHTTIRGGSRAQRALLGRVVRSMGATRITQLRIAPVSAYWHPAQPGDVELDATLAGARPVARRDSRGQWQAWMVGGAFRDRSAQAGLPRVLVLSVVGSGGQRLQPARTRTTSVGRDRLAAVRRQVARAVAESGARLAHLELGTPDGIAIDLSVQARRPATFLSKRFEPLLSKLAIPQIDGRLVEVYGADGHGIYLGASSTRLSSGLGATLDSDYASCVPILTSGVRSLAPPLPCPSTWRPPPSTPAKPLTFYGSESGGKALGTWNGKEGIAVRYVPGAELGIGFVLGNPNGHDVVVQRIAVSQPDGTLIRYTGARIQIPPSREKPGTAAMLEAPYGPVPAFAPFSIRPGDWVGVGLHFHVDACDPSATTSTEPTYETLTVTYLLDGKSTRHTYPGVPLRVAVPHRCTG